MQAEQTELTYSVPDVWRRWIAENKMVGVTDHQIVELLIRRGISEQAAREEVNAVTHHPYFRAGDWMAHRLRKLESLLEVHRLLSAQSRTYGRVERRADLSGSEFLENYYSANRPVILTNLLQNWKALVSWTPGYLKAVCGNAPVEVMTGRASDPRYEVNLDRHRSRMLFREYLDIVTSAGVTNDYYLVANNHFLESPDVAPLLKDFEMFPEYLDPAIWEGRVFFWFGPAGTVTPLHHDTANIFMAQVSGRKRVMLISPDQTHLVYNSFGVYSDVDCEAPDYAQHPLFRDVVRTEVVLEPAEVLFLPVGWWHHVRALDVSITVSFMNFIFPNSYPWFSPDIRR